MNYQEWNSALFADVIDRGDPHRGLYLYVDRDHLAKLSGLSPDQAVEDFCRAFQVGLGDEPFHHGAIAATKWRLAGFPGNPTFVADLAMTVLAVTEDPINGSIHARQNALLGLRPTKIAPAGYDVDVPSLWRSWNRWLDGPGSIHGRPTAASHRYWSLQGWARSQGLIRYHDRLQIEDYLAAHSPSFEAFQSWLISHNPRFLDRFREAPALEILQAIFAEEAVRLAREGRRARGKAGGHAQRRGLLSYDAWTRTFSGAVLIDDTWAGREVDLGAGERRSVDDESVLLIQPDVAETALLTEGVQHRLADGLVVRFGGETLYALRDDARADAMVQLRVVEHATVADLLVHAGRATEVASILTSAGFEAKPSPARSGDWSWFRNVALTPAQPAVLEGLGLSRAARAERTCDFHGGQLVRAGLYLVGGEPDVLFSGDEPVTEVTVNGEKHPVAADDQRLVLSDLGLPPGSYRIESSCGTMSLRTVDFVQLLPVHSDISRPVASLRQGHTVKPTERSSPAPARLAGAALNGVETNEPLVISRRPGTETLMITESGEVSEINPTQPGWLGEAGLRPNAIDVLATVRGTTSPVACVLVRNRTKERVQAIAIPAAAPRFKGRIKSHPRPDLVAPLAHSFRAWSWVGWPHPRINKIMSEALFAAKRDVSAGAPPHFGPAPEIVRTTVAERPIAENPYDDMLTWLSERESGSVTLKALAETWSWLCHRYGLPDLAFAWRRALKVLEDLGHIERHYDTARVGVAPAALVALPASAGLYLLAGARPRRLLERLDDPDDSNPAVAEAALNWQVHRRTPVDAHGRPSGPEAVYLEWDPATRDTVRRGLQALGVTMHGLVADALLAMQPAVSDLDAAGTRLTMSPGSEIHRRVGTPTGYEWTLVRDDARAGFYSYKQRAGRVFAFRAADGSPLVKVEFSVGDWLLRAADGKTTLLCADESGRRRLAVPESVPLPRLLARALVLRSGLPPRVSPIGPGSTNYLIYENIDSTTIRNVAQLLGQQPVTKDITTAHQG